MQARDRSHSRACCLPIALAAACLFVLHFCPVLQRPFPPRQFGLEHQRMAMSRQGVDANYLPAGHILSKSATTFAKTGAGADDALDGAYQAWQTQTNPEDAPKFQTKTERR